MAFMNLIMTGGAGGNAGAGLPGAGGFGGGQGGVPPQQPPGTMRVTPQEMEAI